MEAIIGSTTVRGPDLRVDRRAPIVIAPPLRGGGWAAGNGCCDDPSVNHRSTILFGHYYHLQPGSVRVEVGQRLRTGQKLGLFGN